MFVNNSIAYACWGPPSPTTPNSLSLILNLVLNFPWISVNNCRTFAGPKISLTISCTLEIVFVILIFHLNIVPRGLVVRIWRSHRQGPGSIPGTGKLFLKLKFFISLKFYFNKLDLIYFNKCIWILYFYIENNSI